MYLTHYSNVSDLIKEVHDLFLPSELFKDSYQNEYNGFIPLKFEPQVAIKEEQEILKIELSTPGYSKEELSITVQDQVITIEGKKEGKEESNSKIFKKSITVGTVYDIEKARSNYENGILSIQIEKKEEKKAKELPIS